MLYSASMRRVVYQALLSAPFRIGGSVLTVGGFVGSVWPDKVKAVLNGTSFPIQTIAIAALVVGVIYFALLWLLKPGEKPGGGGLTQSTTGPHSPNFGQARDVHIGDVHHHAPAATQPVKSPYGTARSPWNDPKFNLSKPETWGAMDPPKPNMNLTELLVRVYKKMGPAPKDRLRSAEYFRNVDLEIMDQVVDNGLHVWGRYMDRAREPIRQDSLRKGKLDHRKGTFSVPSVDGVRPMVFGDLRFNREEIDEIWPKQ